MAVQKICQNCQKPFMARSQPGRGKFCSNTCRLAPSIVKANWDNPEVRARRIAGMKAAQAKRDLSEW